MDTTQHLLGGGAPKPGAVASATAGDTAAVPGGDFVTVWLLSMSPVLLCVCCANFGGIIGTCCRLPRFTLMPSILTVFAYGDFLAGGSALTIGLLAMLTSSAEFELLGTPLAVCNVLRGGCTHELVAVRSCVCDGQAIC